MGKLFTEAELLKTAVKIEENGCRFYTEMAAMASKAPVKEMLEFLANQEKGHISAFTHLLQKVNTTDVRESYPGEEDEYIEILASSNVFVDNKQVQEIIARAKTDREIISVAQGFEKDSILFYLAMLTYVASERQGAVKELILKEKEHLVKLSAIKKTLLDFEKFQS